MADIIHDTVRYAQPVVRVQIIIHKNILKVYGIGLLLDLYIRSVVCIVELYSMNIHDPISGHTHIQTTAHARMHTHIHTHKLHTHVHTVTTCIVCSTPEQG